MEADKELREEKELATLDGSKMKLEEKAKGNSDKLSLGEALGLGALAVGMMGFFVYVSRTPSQIVELDDGRMVAVVTPRYSEEMSVEGGGVFRERRLGGNGFCYYAVVDLDGDGSPDERRFDYGFRCQELSTVVSQSDKYVFREALEKSKGGEL